MADFGNLEHEAEQLAGEHSDVVDKGIEEVGQMVDDTTGGHFDSEVQQGEHSIEEDFGGQSGN
jgi:antitoxin protein of toxin-antitoxin system